MFVTYPVVMTRLICVAGILFVSLLLSCSNDDTPPKVIVPSTLTMHKMWEEFNAEGTIRLVGSAAIGSRDTIESIGFVYTDDPITKGTDGIRDPDIDTDHLIEVTELTPDAEHPEYLYSFEAVINPQRPGSLLEGEEAKVNVAAFIKTTTGNTYQSFKWTFEGSKLQLGKIYPAFAKAGQNVDVVVNRELVEGQVKAWASGMAPQSSYPVKLTIGDQEVTITSTKVDKGFDRSIITFTMPDGLDEETSLTLKVDEYSISSAEKIRNSSLSFKQITDKDRDYIGSPILFAAPDAIYFGGGDDDGGEPVQDFWKYTISSNTWTRKADYPADGASGLGMSLYYDNKAWFGQPTHFNRYDLVADTWTALG